MDFLFGQRVKEISFEKVLKLLMAAGGADFQVLSDKEAKEWVEKKLSADEYCKIFGEPEEG